MIVNNFLLKKHVFVKSKDSIIVPEKDSVFLLDKYFGEAYKNVRLNSKEYFNCIRKIQIIQNGNILFS